MRMFTLADGSTLILASDARYEVVKKHLTISGGSPMQEAHRLEEHARDIKEAVARLQPHREG